MGRTVRRCAATIAAVTLFATACGDDGDTTPAPADLAERNTATVTLDGNEYRFADTMSCELLDGGGIRSKFSSGNDLVDLSSVEGDVVVGLRLGGTEWSSTGDAPEPQVSDAIGEAGASWSGEVSDGERIATAELVLAC